MENNAERVKNATNMIVYMFVACTSDKDVNEMEDLLSDVVEQERENRLYELCQLK